jgi:hypothetical protein
MTDFDNPEILGHPRVAETQVNYAKAELQGVSDSLWRAIGYNQDPFLVAQEVFPEATQRRSDVDAVTFECTPEEEQRLREAAAGMGPGRANPETLKDLGVEKVDVEIIEPGQLHKTVTELQLALQSGQTAPIMIFGSDRRIPKWQKDKDTKEEKEELGLDAERVSTTRMLLIGGQGLDEGDFLVRVGEFNAHPDSGAAIEGVALDSPNTEYEATERFILDMLESDDRGVVTDEVLPVSYDPANGELSDEANGQVRRLGSLDGREIFLVHKQMPAGGEALKPAPTMLLLCNIVAEATGVRDVKASFYTSSTYKPSRTLYGIEASLLAIEDGRQHKLTVPTYGYRDLTRITGKKAEPQTIEQIAAELNKTAKAAVELSVLADSIEQRTA